MNPMTSAAPLANSVFVVAPQNGYTVFPGGMSQVPLYPNQQPQVHVIHGNLPGSQPFVSEQLAQRTLKEGKTLGAVQILIGLVHIGLGSVLCTVLLGKYTAVSLYGGFPFWGGIWFIISGAFSVSAENQPKSSCLLKGSLGLNIVGAIFSMTGIMLFITDICISPFYVYPSYPDYAFWGLVPGKALSGVLLVFCFLGFCIACTLSHFGCQLVCYQPNTVSPGSSSVGFVFPNVYVANPAVIPEPATSPPNFSETQEPK
ncbi:membrane-spanning 4-domains subfamily A member 8 isoform X1 [Camelus bactrianus]|uniref:Membrane-spanning 4-domains subfamily A member 8 isoform X1 n=2 Tax=Camelus bactrianus TaxID=9837 RepID=A0AC58R0K2_CAMBA